MSKLLHIKGIILTHMTAEPDLKDAVMEVINSIDSDLDQIEYDEDMASDRTNDAIKNLDKVLTGTQDESEEEEEPPVKRKSPLDYDDEDDIAN